MEPEDRIGLMAAIIAAGQMAVDGTAEEDLVLAQRAMTIALRIELVVSDWRDRRIDAQHQRASNKG